MQVTDARTRVRPGSNLRRSAACYRVSTRQRRLRATKVRSRFSRARGRALFWQGEQQGQNIEVLQGVVRAVRLLAFYSPFRAPKIMRSKTPVRYLCIARIQPSRFGSSPVVTLALV